MGHNTFRKVNTCSAGQHSIKYYCARRPIIVTTGARQSMCVYSYLGIRFLGNAVVYMVEALCYKPEGRGFVSR
jgi:hypothetical protein